MDNELIKEESWWKRNWKWFVPLGGCLTMIILFVVFIGSVFFGVTNALEKSEPYQVALEKANADGYITEQLGTPIKKDGVIQGNYRWNNGQKSAEIKVPVAGPKGSGLLYVNATGEDEEWTYTEMKLSLDKTAEVIDLMENVEREIAPDNY
ncbi:cytochrome c oxidase assembly factor Coa1 family protein [Sungkyunkwania multivorans]|uniref:Cytochrome c oxidase assembly factor Coa1 family protein n=1 Tax=Sungkyunkwania multivorans TaxID=1173618 RepID=A0ABW3D3C4_9FLAO